MLPTPPPAGRRPTPGAAVALSLAALALAGDPAAARPDRVVRLSVAVDEEFRGAPGWRDRARTALETAAAPFLDFGLRLEIAETVDWDTESPDHDLAALHQELVAEVPGGSADLVLGLVGGVARRSDRRFVRLGHSDTPGRYLLVSDLAGRDLPLVLRHELGHAFGVPHVQDVPSIMNEGVDGDRPRFDPTSAAILRNNAGLDFRSLDPLAGCNLETLWGLYDTLAERGNDVADLVAVVGDSYRRRGRPSEARRAYQEALDERPDLLSARVGLAMIALGEGRTAEAIGLLESVQREDPDIGGLDASLGLAYAGLGQSASAIRAYERALDADPDDAATLNNLALLYVEEERYDEAEEMFDRAIDARPRFFEAWNNLGLLFQRQRRYEAAAEAFEASLDIRETAVAHRNLASVQLARGLKSEARKHLEATLRLDPGQEGAEEIRRLAGRLP